MTCSHQSIKAKRKGNTDNCISCGLAIIFDGNKWRWELDLDRSKVQKLKTMFAVDAATGAHDD